MATASKKVNIAKALQTQTLPAVHMSPEDPPNKKKDPKIQKISQNPKNQNNSENVSLKIRPCRP